MGTRADFYVGRGETAEWIGSIAWDGYPEGIDDAVKNSTTEQEYRDEVQKFFADDRDDVTLPADGWPWPWDDSRTSDYAYAFDNGRVWASSFGHAWFHAEQDEPDQDGETKVVTFPNMAERKRVAWDSKKSGIFIIGNNGLEN